MMMMDPNERAELAMRTNENIWKLFSMSKEEMEKANKRCAEHMASLPRERPWYAPDPEEEEEE